MPVTEETYQYVALADSEGQWELHHGRLREKPGMSFEHNDLLASLGIILGRQLNRDRFRIRINTTRVRESSQSYYIPDVCVIPIELTTAVRGKPGTLEFYSDPLPLVAEVWSPSTGDYDEDKKIPEYQRRGDLEIWRLHPYERTLIAWRRQPDGSYAKTAYHGGVVQPVALPGVTIDLGELFETV